MYIVYSKTNGDVFRRVDRTEMAADGILYGYIGESKVGYHPNCNPGVYELTEEQNAAYDEHKLYSFDGVDTLTERELPPIPDEFDGTMNEPDAEVASGELDADAASDETDGEAPTELD